MAEPTEEKLPEELQRRPDAEYLQQIQDKKEADASQALRTQALIGVAVLMVAVVLSVWFLRKRKV